MFVNFLEVHLTPVVYPPVPLATLPVASDKGARLPPLPGEHDMHAKKSEQKARSQQEPDGTDVSKLQREDHQNHE
jgi:hypothetical protein